MAVLKDVDRDTLFRTSIQNGTGFSARGLSELSTFLILVRFSQILTKLQN